MLLIASDFCETGLIMPFKRASFFRTEPDYFNLDAMEINSRWKYLLDETL